MKTNKKNFLIVIPFILLLSFSPRSNYQIQDDPLQDFEEGSVIYFPIIQNNSEIFASTSYYLPSTDINFLYDLGCEHGQRDLLVPGTQDSVIVLDFSYPVYTSDLGFGAALFEDAYSYTEPAPLSAIELGVKRFALGYYQCSGDDIHSNLVIGVGTNNKNLSIQTKSMMEAHGAAWSAMVSNINQWAHENGIIHQVQAYGASNMEVGWNSPELTRAWLSGFEQNGENFMIHFGDASGCPYEDNPHWVCNNYWTLEDLWYVSWGADSALPLPLIYLNDGVHAKQWAYLSQYSVKEHGYRMDFTGVFTQYQYCEQWRDAAWSNCDRTDNTPEEAYLQLTTELNKYPETAQILHWKTDIQWVFESEVSQVDSVINQTSDTPHPIYQQIINIKTGLESPQLSRSLESSMRVKLQILNNLASMIEASMNNPAPKSTQMD